MRLHSLLLARMSTGKFRLQVYCLRVIVLALSKHRIPGQSPPKMILFHPLLTRDTKIVPFDLQATLNVHGINITLKSPQIHVKELREKVSLRHTLHFLNILSRALFRSPTP